MHFSFLVFLTRLPDLATFFPFCGSALSSPFEQLGKEGCCRKMALPIAASTATSDGSLREASVLLIPWDPDSPSHVDRMRLQRIACGWNEEAVNGWRQLQRDGEMGIHWIVSHCVSYFLYGSEGCDWFSVDDFCHGGLLLLPGGCSSVCICCVLYCASIRLQLLVLHFCPELSSTRCQGRTQEL